jgi:hypothetical protein
MRRVLIAAFALLLACGAARSQALRTTPLGVCVLSSLSAATSLTPTTCVSQGGAYQGGIPPRANYAVICAYAQNVVYRDDGVAPTATAGTGGTLLQANFCLPFAGNFQQFQVIQQASGAIVIVDFKLQQ